MLWGTCPGCFLRGTDRTQASVLGAAPAPSLCVSLARPRLPSSGGILFRGSWESFLPVSRGQGLLTQPPRGNQLPLSEQQWGLWSSSSQEALRCSQPPAGPAWRGCRGDQLGGHPHSKPLPPPPTLSSRWPARIYITKSSPGIPPEQRKPVPGPSLCLFKPKGGHSSWPFPMWTSGWLLTQFRHH